MRVLRQIVMITLMNVRTLPERLGSSFVIIIGMTGVVAVLVSVLGMTGGLRETLLSTGSPDRALVLRNGATAEVASVLSAEATNLISNAPGIARTPEGRPALTGDVVVAMNLTKRDGGTGALTVRGVWPESAFVRPEIEIVEGRSFEPGLREAIVGRNAQGEFEGLAVGDQFPLRDTLWTVVGVFTSGDSFESGVFVDTTTLMSAYQRALLSSATVRLESPASFDELKAALTTNPALDVQVLREIEYYQGQSQQLQAILDIVANVVAGIMALGALFAALNSMYSAVSTRIVEIATLRAIGFGSIGVIVSVLTEAMLLATFGAFIGAAVAWLLFHGNVITMGNAVGSVAFQVRVTPALLGIGIVWACGVGFLGGLLPALRAVRLPVATALRATA